jgi:hypothetical protein
MDFLLKSLKIEFKSNLKEVIPMTKTRTIKQVVAIIMALAMALATAVVARAEYYSYEETYNYEDYTYEYEYKYEEDYNYELLEATYISIMPLSLFSGGDGINQPFMLATSADLMQFSNLISGRDTDDLLSTDFFNRADYVLVADINMENHFNFLPIGYQQTNAFTGSFNGNGFTISNLLVSFDWAFVPFGMNVNSLGMFGFVHNADIRNLNLVNPQVVVTGHARDNIAFVVGYAANSRISNVHVTNGWVNARNANQVGGIAGTATGTTITNVSVTGSTIEGVNNVGGITGLSVGGSVTTATVYTTSITGADNTGGVVGNVDGTVISDSGTANGTVITGGDNVGGVFGRATGLANTFNNFSRANITGLDNVGGIGGYMHTTVTGVTLTNSYAAGTVRGNNSVGGILGMHSSSNNTFFFTISDVYSHSTLYATSRAGGILGSIQWRGIVPGGTHRVTVNIMRSYVSSDITITGDFAGGIIGEATPTTVARVAPIADISNTFVITNIVAPSASTAVSIIGNGEILTLTNNYFSFASSVRGGGIGNFEQAVRVHQQAFTLPAWWTATLLIGDAFNTNVIRGGELPTLRKLGSITEVRHQENIDFAGNLEPQLCPDGRWIYVLNSTDRFIVEFLTFGGATVRDIPGLRTPQDYIVLGESIMFQNAFLDMLPVGTFPFRVNFTSGHTIIVNITINAALPVAPRLSASIVDFDVMEMFFGGGFVDVGINKADVTLRGINIAETRLCSSPAGETFYSLLQPPTTNSTYWILRFDLSVLLRIVDSPNSTAGSITLTFTNSSTATITFRAV